MSDNKTKPTRASVADFLNSVEHPTRRADGLLLDQLFRRASGFTPQMWGENMVGYGRYDYRYKSGREGSSLATGFSPRKSKLSIYIMPGYADFGPLLDRLGKHKKAVSCLYVNKLADVDLAVLHEIVCAGLRDLGAIWPVHTR